MKLETSPMSESLKSPHPRWREVLLYGICSVGCMVLVFGSALWGGSLLAPLDIPAAMYSKYHWLNESQGPIPNNHYTIDIFTHELPRQYSVYRALQSEEFPWWDPYTDCGRPLVAEGHISGTDGLRLVLYRVLPFVEAYNLVKIFHSLLLGLGVFILLRRWGHRFWIALSLGLAFEFAGTFALFQTPLCVPASAAWYPWIWLAWSSYVQRRRAGWIGAGGIFCGLSFLAGNQQTDVFLVVFGACFLVGNFWHDRTSWKPALQVSLLSGLLGGLMALPVLVPQAELLLLCKRVPAFADFSAVKLLTGVASMTAAFPWALGTFRTIDASKLFGEYGLGFCLFIGSTAVILGLMGAVGLISRRTPQGCVGLLLVAAYLLVCSTPLVAVFYTRLAGLAVLGLVALAAEGTREILKEGVVSIWQKRLARLALVAVLGALLCCNVFAFLLFPHVRDRLTSVILKRETRIHSFASSPELRVNQVENLPREISVLNPETVVSVLGIGALLVAISVRNSRMRPFWLALALGLNLVPEMSFAHRFTTRAPVEQWQSLLRGGPEQVRVRDALGNGLRLQEEWAGPFDSLFPGVTANFYGVHVTHTYSSFPLPDLDPLWEKVPGHGPWVDAAYVSDIPGSAAGKLSVLPTRPTSSRFQWFDGSQRKVRIVKETFNTITVQVEDGAAGELIRTDRYYPGWKLQSPDLKTHLEQGVFLAVQVPSGRQTLVYEYHPRGLRIAIYIGAGALLISILILAKGISTYKED